MTKITIDRAIVEQALEALKAALSDDQPYIERCRSAEAALRAALEKPVQEPVLVVEQEPDYWSGGHFYQGRKSHIDPTKVWSLPIGTKLYTAPAKGESEGFVDAQAVYQISMKNGATSSAWIDVDEAAYNSAKVYGEYNCRCLYTAPPQLKPLTDEEIDCFAREANLIAESIWVDDSNDDITAFTTALTRLIERAHGIGDA